MEETEVKAPKGRQSVRGGPKGKPAPLSLFPTVGDKTSSGTFDVVLQARVRGNLAWEPWSLEKPSIDVSVSAKG